MDMCDDIIIFSKVSICVILIFCGLVSGIRGLVYCFDSVPAKCFVDGNLVFDGISACIDVKSTGATTRVDISSGFLCMFPNKYYVSKNVKLEGKK